MKVPTFTHGTLENTRKALETGKIKYPAYCWCTDVAQYGFINKNNELEFIGIPVMTGTLDNILILSDLHDGLYQVKGQYKITPTGETIYSSSIDVITIIQTKNNIKRICMITTDDITTYSVDSELNITQDSVVTESYLDSKGYASADYVDTKLLVMEEKIKSEMYSYINTELDQHIEDLINSNVLPVDDSDVEKLFN